MIYTQNQLYKKSNKFKDVFFAVTSFNSFAKKSGSTFCGILSETVFSAAAINRIKNKGIQLPGGTTTNNLIMSRTILFNSSTSELGIIVAESIKYVFYMALGFFGLSFVLSVFSCNQRLDLSSHL